MIFSGLVAGEYIMSYIKGKDKAHSVSLIWVMILGVAALWLLGRIPFVGFIVTIISVVWGAGMMARLQWQTIKQIED